jgi:hypothetical protein
MDSQFERMMQVNIQGRVFIICNNHGVKDSATVRYYTDVMWQAISAMLTDESSPADFHKLLNEQADWLESELSQVRDPPQGDESFIDQGGSDMKTPTALNANSEETGYVPNAKSLPERLKDRRADMGQLLLNDCVTLKLVSPTRAKKLKHELLGKDPDQAEEEIVARLRDSLYEQIRKFILKHNGGPWATATMQAEVRMDITRTRSIRSLVTLSRQLLEEREEWLAQAKNSLSGRFFGGKVSMNK